ncbi:MAG: hypothetical protein J6O51_08625 [Bacteroidales bacterium]|nr:hypothetical protein [Bacteroidales bacterium]
MKSLRIPLLQNLEEQDLDTAIELGGEPFKVDVVNWPSEYPYSPFCCGRIAHTEESLLIDFRVSGLDLRVQGLSDKERIWEDSACEFFVQVPGSEEYFNFEVNPAGRLVAARGAGRAGRTALSDEDFGKIVRISSVDGVPLINVPLNYEGGIWNWRVLLIIPFEVLGLEEAPSKLLGNIYKCGDLTAHPHYVTWAPVGTPAPDFHRPEFFGEFILG